MQGLALLLLSTAATIWTGKRGRGQKSSPAVHADPAFHNRNTWDRVGYIRVFKKCLLGIFATGCHVDQKRGDKVHLLLSTMETLEIGWTAK